MTLNLWERLLVNNPVRAFVQHHVEAPRLLRLGGRLDGKDVLEIGCGRGVGVEVIFKRFGAARVTAFDVDPKMVTEAHKRLAVYSRERLRLSIGDATAIAAADESFDAVFDFGILHHVPDWQKAVREVARVLKPGGRFYFEEITAEALDRWLYRTFLDHPKENRFGVQEFIGEIEQSGIMIGTGVESIVSKDIFTGVGTRIVRNGGAAGTRGAPPHRADAR